MSSWFSRCVSWLARAADVPDPATMTIPHYTIPQSGTPRLHLAGSTVVLTVRPVPPADGPELIHCFSPEDLADWLGWGNRLLAMARAHACGDDGGPSWDGSVLRRKGSRR